MSGWQGFSDFEEDETPVDDQPIDFGKYKGQSPNQIAKHDPGYVVWAYENRQGFCSELLYLSASQQADDDRDEDSYSELDFN